MLYIALLLLVLSIVLFWIARRQRRQAGLPGGRLVYSDTRTWGKVEQPLYDPELALTGRPDYLVEQEGRFIPVEVKTGRTPAAPYDSHIFQLAAYCQLVAKKTGRRPTHGIIHYPASDYAVDYTPELESALLDLLADIRRDERGTRIPRSHEETRRCARCGFRGECDQRLG